MWHLLGQAHRWEPKTQRAEHVSWICVWDSGLSQNSQKLITPYVSEKITDFQNTQCNRDTVSLQTDKQKTLKLPFISPPQIGRAEVFTRYIERYRWNRYRDVDPITPIKNRFPLPSPSPPLHWSLELRSWVFLSCKSALATAVPGTWQLIEKQNKQGNEWISEERIMHSNTHFCLQLLQNMVITWFFLSSPTPALSPPTSLQLPLIFLPSKFQREISKCLLDLFVFHLQHEYTWLLPLTYFICVFFSL